MINLYAIIVPLLKIDSSTKSDRACNVTASFSYKFDNHVVSFKLVFVMHVW